MALSKEFYLDEIRSKHPNSYNEGLKDLPVKDLEDMLDFLDEALDKADGGSIGIEVLFGPKRDEYQTGGRIGFNMGGAQFTSGDNISPGTDKRGKVRNDNPFTGGGGGDDGPKGPPAIINPPPTKDKSTELLTFDEYTGKPMTYADVATANKFLNLVKTKGSYTMGEDPEADALYDAYRTATGRDTFMQDATVDSVTNMRTTDIDGDTKSFFDQTSTITDNPTGKMTKSLMVETPTSFTQRFITPTGIMENDVPQKFGAPQSLAVDPPKNIIGSELKDGGRVGFFMGGPALEGQALQIYNSMNSYGFSDQEIADALSARGLYTPAGSGTGTETTQPNIIGAQLNQGDGGGITELQKTFTPGAQPKGPKFDPNINPAAQLTGEGRLDPMGSDVDYFNTLPGSQKFNFGFKMSDVPGQPGYKAPSKYFEEPSMINKGITAVKDFFGKFSSPKVKGTLGTRLANQPRLPLPGAIASYSLSPFNPKSKNFNPLLESQLNFAELGNNIIGMSNTGLKYDSGSVLAGKNVISAFGTNDYEKMLVDYISKMNAYQNKKATEARAAKIAKAQAELKALQEATKAAKEAAGYGKTDYGQGVGGQSYSGDALGAKDLGFGIGATTGGPVSNRTGRGRTDYSKGGLATMFRNKK